MPKFLASTPKHVISAQLKRAARQSGLSLTKLHVLCGCSSYAQLNAAFNGGSLGPRMRERMRLLDRIDATMRARAEHGQQIAALTDRVERSA